VRVVLFRHARIGVAQLFGDDSHRHATHGERRAVRVPKPKPNKPPAEATRHNRCRIQLAEMVI
jgi:hypothetical protein